MLDILVIWVSNTLYLIHKSLKTVLSKILIPWKLVKYEKKKNCSEKYCLNCKAWNVINKRLQHMCIYTCFYAEGNKKRGDRQSPYSLHPPFCFSNLVPNLQKVGRKGGGSWQDLNFVKGVAEKERDYFFQGDCNYFT